jgi:hypothetical protein
VSGQTVELVTEASASSQLVRRMGAWEDEQTTVLQNVVVTMGESFVHPEVEEQLLYAKNIGHEVSVERRKIRLIESNAKCRYLKKPVMGLCGAGVFICYIHCLAHCRPNAKN